MFDDSCLYQIEREKRGVFFFFVFQWRTYVGGFIEVLLFFEVHNLLLRLSGFYQQKKKKNFIFFMVFKL